MIREVTMYQAVCDRCGRKYLMYKDNKSAFVAATRIGGWGED